VPEFGEWSVVDGRGSCLPALAANMSLFLTRKNN